MPNNMQRFTQGARRALSHAQQQAEALHSRKVGTEYLLLGTLLEGESIASRALTGLGVDAQYVRGMLEAINSAAPDPQNATLELSSNTKKSLELAVDQARLFGNRHIGTEHLLLALARLPDCTAMTILKKRGISPVNVRQQVHNALQARVPYVRQADLGSLGSQAIPGKMQRFTHHALQVLKHAQGKAEALDSDQIGTEHLLLGLLEGDDVASHALTNLGAEIQQIHDALPAMTSAAQHAENAPLSLSSDLKKTLELAVDQARILGDPYIGTEHLLLGLSRLPDCTAMSILKTLDITPEAIRRQCRRILQNTIPRSSASEVTPMHESLPQMLHEILRAYELEKYRLRVVVKDQAAETTRRAFTIPMADVMQAIGSIIKETLRQEFGEAFHLDIDGIGHIELSVEPNESEEEEQKRDDA